MFPVVAEPISEGIHTGIMHNTISHVVPYFSYPCWETLFSNIYSGSCLVYFQNTPSCFLSTHIVAIQLQTSWDTSHIDYAWSDLGQGRLGNCPGTLTKKGPRQMELRYPPPPAPLPRKKWGEMRSAAHIAPKYILPRSPHSLKSGPETTTCRLPQSSKKERKTKKKDKTEKAEKVEDAGSDVEEKPEPKRAQRATSNVFALFNQSQIQEFKEVGRPLVARWRRGARQVARAADVPRCVVLCRKHFRVAIMYRLLYQYYLVMEIGENAGHMSFKPYQQDWDLI